MRLAFTLFGDDSWTGGLNYLRNLLSALHEAPGRPVQPVLFVAPQTAQKWMDELAPYLAEPPIVVAAWGQENRIRRFIEGTLLQRDEGSLAAFRKARIDAVFQNDAWYGARFPLPIIFWIADFQHKHLREMFSPYRRFKRDLGYALLCRLATRVMVSSEDARRDCESYLPRARQKISVVPFAVQTPDPVSDQRVAEVLKSHNLPDKFLYFPGQLWRHKNHLALIEAVRILRDSGKEVVVVATGNPKDRRNPDHPQRVLDTIAAYGLAPQFRFLGMVPYNDIAPLMTASVALVNPSLFEGWSTTVEEAKALGVPLVLSNLKVHTEQVNCRVEFFDPRDPEAIARALWRGWNEWSDRSSHDATASALNAYQAARVLYGNRLVALSTAVLSGRVLDGAKG